MEKCGLLNSSRNRGGGIKENDGVVNLRYIIRAFVNVTLYPQYNNNNRSSCYWFHNSKREEGPSLGTKTDNQTMGNQWYKQQL
jgi:hypothetical protein